MEYVSIMSSCTIRAWFPSDVLVFVRAYHSRRPVHQHHCSAAIWHPMSISPLPPMSPTFVVLNRHCSVSDNVDLTRPCMLLSAALDFTAYALSLASWWSILMTDNNILSLYVEISTAKQPTWYCRDGQIPRIYLCRNFDRCIQEEFTNCGTKAADMPNIF